MFSVEQYNNDEWAIVADNIPRRVFSAYRDANARLPLLRRAQAVFESRSSSDLEIAGMIQELRNAGFSQSDIAVMFKRQETWISFYHKLNNLSPPLLAHLRNDVIKPTALVKALGSLTEDTIDRTIKSILDEQRRLGYRRRITQRLLMERAAA